MTKLVEAFHRCSLCFVNDLICSTVCWKWMLVCHILGNKITACLLCAFVTAAYFWLVFLINNYSAAATPGYSSQGGYWSPIL